MNLNKKSEETEHRCVCMSPEGLMLNCEQLRVAILIGHLFKAYIK